MQSRPRLASSTSTSSPSSSQAPPTTSTCCCSGRISVGHCAAEQHAESHRAVTLTPGLCELRKGRVRSPEQVKHLVTLPERAPYPGAIPKCLVRSASLGSYADAESRTSPGLALNSDHSCHRQPLVADLQPADLLGLSPIATLAAVTDP